MTENYILCSPSLKYEINETKLVKIKYFNKIIASNMKETTTKIILETDDELICILNYINGIDLFKQCVTNLKYFIPLDDLLNDLKLMIVSHQNIDKIFNMLQCLYQQTQSYDITIIENIVRFLLNQDVGLDLTNIQDELAAVILEVINANCYFIDDANIFCLLTKKEINISCRTIKIKILVKLYEKFEKSKI